MHGPTLRKMETGESEKLLAALEARRAMHSWATGLALLTSILLTAPQALHGVSASAQETPQVTVKTVRGPGAGKSAPAPKTSPAPAAPARSRVAASRSTYRRSGRTASGTISRRSRTASRPARTERVASETARTERAASAPTRRVRSRRLRTASTRTRRDSTRVAAAPRPGESAESLNLRAYRLQKQGRHREAEPLLREALRKRPDYAYAQYNLGWSLVRQGKAGEAVLYLKQTAKAQPQRREPLDKLAEAYERLGNRKQAEETRARARDLRKPRSGDRAAVPQMKTGDQAAVAPVAWRQSTDTREDAWLREKRELAAVPQPAGAPEPPEGGR